MKTLLKRQCSGVWRLGQQGHWQSLYTGSVQETVEGIAELFASVCMSELNVGDEIVAKFGDWTLVAVLDDQGVLIGVQQKGGNPVTIRTAMNRLEIQSQHAQVAFVPEPPAIPTTANTGSFSSVVEDVISDAPHTFEWEKNTESSESQDPLYFEIEFNDESVDDYAPMVASQGGCVQAHVSEYIEQLLEASTPYLGRTSAAKYWSDAIRAETNLRDWLDVDLRGRVRVTEPAAEVPAHQLEALERARLVWLERGETVVSGLWREINLDRPCPWTHLGTT